MRETEQNTGDNYPVVSRAKGVRWWLVAAIVAAYFMVCAGIIFYFDDPAEPEEAQDTVVMIPKETTGGRVEIVEFKIIANY